MKKLNGNGCSTDKANNEIGRTTFNCVEWWKRCVDLGFGCWVHVVEGVQTHKQSYYARALIKP